MKRILIVDDSEVFIRQLIKYFQKYSPEYEVLTAQNGKEALSILEREPIDLVLTDLCMPEMDGIELLSRLNDNYGAIPTIAMTAHFAEDVSKKLDAVGQLTLLRKPFEFKTLLEFVRKELKAKSQRGEINGLSLANFLQLIEMEMKTCLVDVSGPDSSRGYFYLKKGILEDAITLSGLKGEQAAIEMLTWEHVKIKYQGAMKKKIRKRIKSSLMSLIMKGAQKQDDDHTLDTGPAIEGPPMGDDKLEPVEVSTWLPEPAASMEEYDSEIETDQLVEVENKDIAVSDHNSIKRGDSKMAQIEEILEKCKDINGFQAVGVFSPEGELAGEINVSNYALAEMGALANDVLLKSQKTSEVMGIGRGNMVHIQAPKAQVITRCLNESTDFSATNAGRAHIHMVLVLENEGNLAMAKMKVNSIIQELAPHFR